MRVVELGEAVRLATAVQAVGTEPRVVTSGNFATPLPLLEAIAAELPSFVAIAVLPIARLADPEQPAPD